MIPHLCCSKAPGLPLIAAVLLGHVTFPCGFRHLAAIYPQLLVFKSPGLFQRVSKPVMPPGEGLPAAEHSR